MYVTELVILRNGMFDQTVHTAYICVVSSLKQTVTNCLKPHYLIVLSAGGYEGWHYLLLLLGLCVQELYGGGTSGSDT
jgi:hypothetical protein